MLLAKLLEKLIRIGRLTVVDAHGKTHVFQGSDGPAVTIRLHDRSLHWKMFLRPDLATGEAYMDGILTVEDADLYAFLDLIGRNMQATGNQPLNRATAAVSWLFRRLHQFNPENKAQSNVAHHYDLSGALYDLFLDSDRQYSCAYFRSPDDDLETAQGQKKRHIAAKLLIKPGMSVLDIGSGWGDLGLHLARDRGAQVTGITLSREQLDLSRARAQEAGLADRVEFHIRDYRNQIGTFDRIVSVGMFEHVGVVHFAEYFSTIRDRLADDGVALLHTIGRTDGPGSTNPWMRKYIFPGGYIPALSEILPVVEDNGLYVTDVEVLRLHYADTLRHWRARFLANRDKASALYDDRFCRMWEFYLAGSEISFRYLNCVVFQLQLAKRQDAVPLIRDYIAETERPPADRRDQDSDRAA